VTVPALPPVLIVSGTGTEVGKTVVTAAIAADRGIRVAVVKPAQTGEPPGPTGDLSTIRRLSGVTQTHELARFGDPLSPEAAARAAGLPPLDLTAAAVHVKQSSPARAVQVAASRDRRRDLVDQHPGGLSAGRPTSGGLALLAGAY
jgi:dethiobiotin synthetase